MLVCCGNGKPWHTMDQFDRLSCNYDMCTGPREESMDEEALRELAEQAQELGLYSDEDN